ncbi:MAG: hypothetical protein AAF556_07495 [Pseudomonadota bacterium]
MSASYLPAYGGMGQSPDNNGRADMNALQANVDQTFGQPTDMGAIFAGGKPQLRLAGLDGVNEAPGQGPQMGHGQKPEEKDSEFGQVAGMMITAALPGAAAIAGKALHAQEFYEKEVKSDAGHAHMGRRADGTMTVNNDEVMDMGKPARDHAMQARARTPMGRI